MKNAAFSTAACSAVLAVRGGIPAPAGGESAAGGLLAAGARGRRGERQFGRLPGGRPASARGPVGPVDVGGAGEPGLPERVVLLVCGAPAGPLAAAVGRVQLVAGRISAVAPPAQRDSSGSRPGRRRPLARSPVLDLAARRSGAAAAVRQARRRLRRDHRPRGVRNAVADFSRIGRRPRRGAALRPGGAGREVAHAGVDHHALARLALGDLFLHGIGGAKYDRLTDVLACRFFGFHLPQFMAISATKRLPIPHDIPRPDEQRRVEAELRQLTFQPERRLDPGAHPADEARRIQDWIDTKRRWIGAAVTPDNARARFLAIREANERLQPWVADRRQQLLERRARSRAALRSEAVLSSREYGFCLFPEESLQSFLLAIRPNTS